MRAVAGVLALAAPAGPRAPRVLALPLALLAFVAFPSLARAATVSLDGAFLRIAALPGEANQLAIGAAVAPSPGEAAPRPASSFTITDTGVPLTAGPGCTQTDAGVTCVTAGAPEIDVSAGDGDDSVTIDAAVPAFVDAGPGADAVDVGNGLSDSVWCSRGRDSVTGEVVDFVDLGCEHVDYGLTGAVGRLRWLTGGGRWAPVPGQTWARVDRRILPDVLYLVRRYHVRIVEGYGTVGHERFGEHPLGLAVDIEPGAGGTWDEVSRLARWAEPVQNRPRGPFRWVGWNGDFNHGHPSVCKPRLGCAPHLHLSWSHSPTPPRHLARTVRAFEVR